MDDPTRGCERIKMKIKMKEIFYVAGRAVRNMLPVVIGKRWRGEREEREERD